MEWAEALNLIGRVVDGATMVMPPDGGQPRGLTGQERQSIRLAFDVVIARCEETNPGEKEETNGEPKASKPATR